MTLLKKLAFSLAAVALTAASGATWAGDRVVVIAHAGVRKLDLPTVQRIYTGKAVEVDGARVVPVNAAPALPLRQRFLSQYLQMDEDQYVAYWTVRRYVGKGTPPQEAKTTAEMIEAVNRTPGAIGYLAEDEVPANANVVLRK